MTEPGDKSGYPPIRLRKLKADGVVYISWNGYRLPDHDGFVGLFVPQGRRDCTPKGPGRRRV